jgi:cysteine desulfurase / selenocysteine lyase
MMREQFPLLRSYPKLVYLDNAATTQKPDSVVRSIISYYETLNSNVHRGVYRLSEDATNAYENARKKVANFINASPEELIFTKGATESLNRVAFEWALENLKKGDVILVSIAEHHSNMLPWKIVCDRVGAKLQFIDLDAYENLDMTAFDSLLNEKVKLVAISQISNVLGLKFPVREICKKAHEIGARVVVDGAQAISHEGINVKSMGCDFYAFSGHKMYGPMGVGVLWVKKELLENMPPYEYGGGMVTEVTKTDFQSAPIPVKFEAGTPNVAGVLGLSAAVDFINKITLSAIKEHENSVLEYAFEKLRSIKRLKIIGTDDVKNRASLISFAIEGIHPHDIAAVADNFDVAVRAGRHCAMPLHEKYNLPGTVRMSLAIYNTHHDVDMLYKALLEAIKILG